MFRLLTSHFPLLTSDFRLPTSDFQLPTSHVQLPTSNFRLPTWLLCQARLPRAVPLWPQKRTTKVALVKATKYKANQATDEVRGLGKYPQLATSTLVNNCYLFSLLRLSVIQGQFHWKKKLKTDNFSFFFLFLFYGMNQSPKDMVCVK